MSAGKFQHPTLAACLAVCSLLGLLWASSASAAWDAGLRSPSVTNTGPGARTGLTLPIRLNGTNPQPEIFEISLRGFGFEPAVDAGTRIGVIDLETDAGDFPGNPIAFDSIHPDGSQDWNVSWGLGDPFGVRLTPGVAITADGGIEPDSGSTLLRFVIPAGNYHGFKTTGLSVRLEQGVTNPPAAGRYLIRSRITSEEPQSLVSLSSRFVTIGKPTAPATSLSVSANRRRVKPGGSVRFRLRTTNRTTDRIVVKLGRHKIRTITVGPDGAGFSWRAPDRLAGRKLTFRFIPSRGKPRSLGLKVAG